MNATLTKRLGAAGLAALLTVAMAATSSPATTATNNAEMMDVIVRMVDGASLSTVIESSGGTVTSSLDAIDAITATIPADAIARIEANPLVLSVTTDSTVQLASAGWDTSSKDVSSLKEVAEASGAASAWENGATGAGVTVALIDSGVTPVEGLATSGKIINGPDLSFDSQIAGMANLDAFGHGTHMAGIIAGQATGVTKFTSATARHNFLGIAPEASILNMKVGAANGAVDVSQVLAAINWVIEHRTDNGMNVRVLNLSFGTDSTQAYEIDPLSYAVEVAWRNGIVVVVAAGNDANSSALRSPATNPFVIAVGADDMAGTTRLGDDSVPTWSNCGTGRTVDLIAPGRSIASLRVPGSYADTTYPLAAIEGHLFKGSGTSQAAAVVSGIAALVLDAHPQYTPDQVKAVMTGTANPLNGESATCQGAGVVDAYAAVMASNPGSATQSFTPANGTGTLEAARGSDHLSDDGVILSGEIDIFGDVV